MVKENTNVTGGHVFSTWFHGILFKVDMTVVQHKPAWGPDFKTIPDSPVPNSDKKCLSDRL